MTGRQAILRRNRSSSARKIAGLDLICRDLETTRKESLLLPCLSVSRQLAERVAAREALRGEPSGIGAVAAPIGKLLERERKRAAGSIRPRQPLLHLEGLDVGQPAILVALQPHAASPRHLRHLFERENQHLAIVADGGDQLALHHPDGARLVRHRHIDQLLALAGVGEAFVLRHDKAATFGARDQELATALMTEYGDDVRLLLHIDEETDRFAVPAAAGKLRRVERVKAPIGGKYQTFRGSLSGEGELRPVVGLERDA